MSATYTVVLTTDAASDELHEVLAMLDPNAEVYPGRLAGGEDGSDDYTPTRPPRLGWCHVCGRNIRAVTDHAAGCAQAHLGPEHPMIAPVLDATQADALIGNAATVEVDVAGGDAQIGELILRDDYGITLEHHDGTRTRIPFADIRGYEQVEA